MDQQSPKKVIRLKYQDKTIPQKFPINQNIGALLLTAKSSFKCQEEDTYVIVVDGVEQSEELLISDLHLEQGQVLELLKKTSPPQDLVTFSISKEADDLECTYSLSRSIGEALRDLFAGQNFDLSSYRFLINGEEIEETRILGTIDDLEDIVVELVQKEEVILETAHDGIFEEEKFEEQEISFIQDENLMSELSINWFLRVKDLKIEVAERLSIPTEGCHQVWLVDNNELDDTKPLNLQLISPDRSIVVEMRFNIPVQIDLQSSKVEKILAMNLNDTIKQLKLKLEKEIMIQPLNQIWHLSESKEELKDEVKLSGYISDNQMPKPKICIKKQENHGSTPEKAKPRRVYIFEHNHLLLKKEFALDESITFVLTSLKNRLKISNEAKIGLVYNQVLMDSKKRLNDYNIETGMKIILQELDNQPSLETLSVLFQGELFEIPAKNASLVNDLKQEACKRLGIHAPQLYSLKFENNVLNSTQLLKSIPNLVGDSVLELSTEIKVSFIFLRNQEPTRFDLAVDSMAKVEEMKKRIQNRKLVDYQEFILLLGSTPLENGKYLSQYIEEEADTVIEIKEKSRKSFKFEITFNKLPEGPKHLISVLENETFNDLALQLSDKLKIDPMLQVWKHQDTKILDERDWRHFVNLARENVTEMKLDVFECLKPSEQIVFINKKHLNTQSEDKVKLDLLESVSELKKQIAEKWKLPQSLSQVWMVKSREIKDHLPLAVHYKVLERDILDITLCNLREFKLSVEEAENLMPLDIDLQIADLKKHLFKTGTTNIKPEKQMWSLDTNQLLTFEDHQTLSYYLNNNKTATIFIKERAQLIKLQYEDIEVGNQEIHEIEGDAEFKIKDLKERARSKLGLPAEEQFWMINNEELIDDCLLKQYVLSSKFDPILIEVYALKRFIIDLKTEKMQLSVPLITSIKKFKEKIIEKYPAYKANEILLQADEKNLDETKSLQDYPDVWSSNSRPVIRVNRAARLTIRFQQRTEEFYFGSHFTPESLRQEIRRKFSIEKHKFHLFESDKACNQKEIEKILESNQDKVLTCKKIKQCTFMFEDLPQNENQEVLILASEAGLDDIEKMMLEQRKMPNQNLMFLYQGRVCPKDKKYTLDDIDSTSSTLFFKVQMIKEIEVSHQDKKLLIDFLPTQTIGEIKSKLKEKGASDIMNFSFQKDGRVLSDQETLESYQIVYGKHQLTTKSSLVIIVLVNDEEIRCVCGSKLQTIADLKQKLEEHIDLSRQVLILLDGQQQWVRRLNKDQDKLEGLATNGEAAVQILCKSIKRFSIKIGSQNNIESFQGILHSTLEEQKRLVEIDYKIPVNNQVWAIQKGRKYHALKEEDFHATVVDTYNQSNPIGIFRRINLSVCLTDRSEILEDVSSYETIREQKDKIAERLKVVRQSQRWSYNERELEDDKTLEESFERKAPTENLAEAESFALDLIILTDLEYYGFTDKKNINVDLFKNFFLESDEDLNRIVASVNFSKKDDSFQFRDKVLGLFFGTLKKHSLWEGLISRIKKKMFDIKAVNLWANHEKKSADQSKFNTQFLLYYFLNSGSSELNIEILKIMKMHFPVPLAIKTWSNRFSVEDHKIVDDLYWIVQKGFYIASFGYGGAENKDCGKTLLTNKLVSSNFVSNSERNSICRGCPEILFDIYKNDKFPINLIDIPSGTDEKIKKRILSCANMLIVHSLAEEEQTREFLRSQQINIPTIVLYRDVQDAFYNITKFKDSLIEEFNKALETNIFEIKITDSPNYESSNELDHLAEKIHEFILENFKRLGSKNKELWKFLQFFGNHNIQVDELFDRVREKSSEIVKVVPIFNALKSQERKKIKEVSADNEKFQEESKICEQSSLSLELEEFLRLLKLNDSSSQEETSHLFLEKFQDFLRMMKNQQTLDFYKLYEFKSKLSKSEGANEKVIAEFAEYWRKVKNQEVYYQNSNFDVNTAKTQGLNFIKECIKIFEKDIIPKIFSIELFWRELIYHDSLQRSIGQTESENSNARSKSAFSSDFLISLKKEDILKGFPFEIIDGDLLHMPKEFLKSVFKGMKDRVIVISVLGPQSSGKSTLLNFLFGCNFVTSSGRCTKGVYGTYFKVSNINSCDGILVLDTEGLFGLLNKDEEQQRDKFDRRLVLFCLAMSDIVLVNFKGDIDRTLTQVMMVCKDSLKNLHQGNIQIPEMFLILNQNSQTNRETQLQDIDKMGDLGFSSENVKILSLAFDTKKEKISTIEKYMDLPTKKTPKEDFSEECRQIAQELFEKISYNGNKNVQRTLESTMDTMEHLWELLDKFPDLLRHSNLQDQDQEKKIKEWIEKEVDENLKKRLCEIANNLKNSDKIKLNWEKEFHEKFTEEEKSIKYNFGEEFKEQTDRHLFEDLESVLYTHIDRIRIELENELNIQSHHEKIKVYDAQGIEMIREAAYQLRNKDNLSDVEKETYFEEAWQKHIAKSENFYNRDKESENLFQTVVENYKTNLHQITGCLPSSKFPKRDNILFKDYQQALQRILDRIYKTEKRFEYTKQRPALIFKGGKGNISFKYLDLKQYFEKTQLNENMGIHRSKIFNIFDIEKIKERSSQSPDFQDQKRIAAEYILREVAAELDQCGIWISQPILESYLMYEQQWRIAQWFTSPFKDSDLISSAFSFRTPNQYPPLLKFVDLYKIERKKKDIFKSTATNKSFISYVLTDCIKWKEIKDVLSNEIKETYKTVQNSSLVAEIEADLAKIHLEFRGLSHYISFICYSDEKSIKEIMRDHVFLNHTSLSENSVKDINSISFNYLKKDAIQKHLQKVESNSPDYLIIQRLKGEKWVTKKDFGNVNWLNSYAKEDLSAIFQNTMEDKTLQSFISQQFKFRELIEDIFAICASKIQSIDNYSSIQLYQQIARETNDLIGMANNDLQQVSYRLDFKLVGEIHLQMVHLIWKYFEERHWEKITQPLEDMKNRKEQQKGFFKLVASSDDRQINKAEAEKIGNYAEEYAKSRVQTLKEEIIRSSVENFKKQTRRRKIQDQLDSKYFSRNAVSDNDDLYFYILNPREAILKAYEDTSDQFCRDLENQIQGQSKYLNDLLSEFMARIIKVQSVLNSYDEDFWALHHIFEFKKVQVSSKDEVLMKKYHSKIAQVYYRITLAFLQGNVHNIFKEYEITAELKVVLKKIESIQIFPLENKDVSKIIKNLESRSGNVTNARLFIESLLKEVEVLKKNSDKFFHFSLEDLKEFKDKSNVFVCKQKCPCCDRICGEEDPTHKTHRCLYGHQIRAIGGTMIETKEASIARCEDISDLDKMIFNGRDLTWAEFKEERKIDPNNPWSFDDVLSTRNETFLREKFELAWTLIGKRICEEKHKGSEMKFVPFNKTTIDAQKAKFAKPSNYIFMIDSSGSMSGDRWTDLKKSLKETLGKISSMNRDNKVSIINFSSIAQIAYENTPANSISVDVLNFSRGGTDFPKAFAAGFELMKKVKQENIVLIFMTDGEAGYPTEEICDIKRYLGSSEFLKLKIKFSFNAIGFKLLILQTQVQI
jgi:hypothetical protein